MGIFSWLQATRPTLRQSLTSTLSTALWTILLGVNVFNLPNLVYAQDCNSITCSRDTQAEEEYLSCNKQKQTCLEGKIAEAQAAKITLGNTISILNGQIGVQQLQIEQTVAEISGLERQIIELSDRIEGLDLSLDKLTNVLVKRVGEHYKRSYTNPMLTLFAHGDLNTLLSEYKYLQLTQRQTVEAMQRAETQRLTYDEQKQLKEVAQAQLETKNKQLEAQRGTLTSQKRDQEFLLAETRNNEARYQQELAKTMAELEAIQSIIAGRGNESKVGDVSQGDKIATVIAGASACSTGSHLHFEVAKDNVHRDPAGYLKSIDASWNNNPDSSFGFSGNWDWPVDDPAKINQGYGMTYYARVRRAYGGAPHTGIDMFSKTSGNYTVKAVKAGTLYRGSIACGGGLLRYVRVQHQDDSSLSTYYLHVNY
jgi:peptidoglycan hydrolase CwlO-like protein